MMKRWMMVATMGAALALAGNALAAGSGSVNPTSGWFPAGTNLTVTATAGENDMLKGWTGDTNSATFGEATITFLVDARKAITATFVDILHTITASAGAGGSISESGENSVAQGDDKTFTITPDEFYHIAGVLVDGSPVGATNSYTFSSVMAAHTIAASFDIDSYLVTFLAGAYGTITGGDAEQTIDHGSDAVAPTITADLGYSFANWDGSYTGVTSARTLTALYTTNSYTLTFDSAGGSTVDPITQPYTTSVSAPTPPTKTGYSFAGWVPAVAATMPNSNQEHVAQWTTNQFQLIIISEHGAPNPSATNEYAYGTTVEFAVAGSPEIIENDSKFDATGWVGSGSVGNGSGTNGSFVIEQNSTLTWQWSTNYWIQLNTAGE